MLRVHWLVIGLSLLLTVTVSFVTRAEIDAKVDARFEQQSEQIVSRVIERMVNYEGSLWGGVSALRATGGDMSHQQWLDFSTGLNIDERYPGINGIGVIHNVEPDELEDYLESQREDRPDYGIHPAHEEDTFLPISYIEPSGPNANAVGLDMAHEANRFNGVLRARDTGTAQITGPIVLVQDSTQTPGFLFFAPWYEGEPVSRANRAAMFSGVVYAPFVFNELMHGALDETQREVSIRIADGNDVLFDEHNADVPGFDADPLLTQTSTVPIFGRLWTFDIRTDQAFRESAANNEPLIILLAGLFINALLFALFTSISRSQRQAHVIAEDLTKELRVNSKRLEESNVELERFAYVASHDLRTPLRGIADLAEYIEEDLADHLSSPSANPDVVTNLGRLNGQVNRMDALIKGILDYSRIGGGDNEVHPFSLDAAISTVATDLGLTPSQVELRGESSWVVPAGIYLEQVLQNLLVNAVAHHHLELEHVKVTVTAVQVDDRLAISVADNGPGIEPRHHGRIFDLFQRLEDASEGTGIGLSIVKRVVESHGGEIHVSSRAERGTTFAFSWPGTLATSPNDLDQPETNPLVPSIEGTP